MKGKYTLQLIEGDHKEKGVYNSATWRSEAEAHFQSALELRELSSLAKDDVNRARAENRKLDREILEIMKRRRNFAKSSLLLLGYALELSLKSGVVSLFRDIPRKYLKDALKTRFSHRHILIAKFIELPLSAEEETLLDQVADLIVADARYPITPSGAHSYIKEYNRLGQTIMDNHLFDSGIKLYKKIIDHTKTLNGTEESVLTHGWFEIGSDGAMACRLGGGVSNRILVAYSTEQKSEGENNALKLWKLIENNAKDNFVLSMLIHEGIDSIKIFEL
tara:strand:+ start:5317 stop:6147 length:831 start_codon:yes stop_codon:yes gene_type:complete